MNQPRVPAGSPDGGRFGTASRDEAEVALAAPAAGHPVAAALAGLPGTVEVEGDLVRYTCPDGHLYRLAGGETSLSVSADGVSSQAVSFSVGAGLRPESTARRLLADVMQDANDTRTFTAAARHLLGESVGAEVDDYSGAAWHDGITFEGYTSRHPATDGPALMFMVANGDDYDAAPVQFEALRLDDGQVQIVRSGDETTPLVSWERAAVEAEVARRLASTTSTPVSDLVTRCATAPRP